MCSLIQFTDRNILQLNTWWISTNILWLVLALIRRLNSDDGLCQRWPTNKPNKSELQSIEELVLNPVSGWKDTHGNQGQLWKDQLLYDCSHSDKHRFLFTLAFIITNDCLNLSRYLIYNLAIISILTPIDSQNTLSLRGDVQNGFTRTMCPHNNSRKKMSPQV